MRTRSTGAERVHHFQKFLIAESGFNLSIGVQRCRTVVALKTFHEPERDS